MKKSYPTAVPWNKVYDILRESVESTEYGNEKFRVNPQCLKLVEALKAEHKQYVEYREGNEDYQGKYELLKKQVTELTKTITRIDAEY